MTRKSRVFISHSSKDDVYAGAIRDAVEKKLHDLGYEVLLDRARLDPGDRWRAKLHRWLGACDGAVLLFGPAALASDWMRKEATILTWRREFDPQIRIVPAVFGGVAKTALTEYGLSPLDLEEHQIAEVDEETGSELERAERLADAIAAGFAGLAPLVTETPMRRWVDDIADLIRDNSFLESAAAVLFEAEDFTAGADPVEPQRVGDFAVSAERVAYQLLHSDPLIIERAFDELIRGHVRNPRRLAELVTPSWVPAESAKAIAAALERPAGQRRVALRATQTSTPDHVVLKGTCSDNRHHLVPAKSERATTEEPEVELAHLYRGDILAKLGAVDSRGEHATSDVHLAQDSFEQNRKRLFVVLPATTTGRAVGHSLWGEYGLDKPVYVLAGNAQDVADTAAAVEAIAVVEPELDERAETEGTLVANRLQGLAEAQRGAWG